MPMAHEWNQHVPYMESHWLSSRVAILTRKDSENSISSIVELILCNPKNQLIASKFGAILPQFLFADNSKLFS